MAALPPHRFAVTVYYEDTDMGGIVYHANYLKFIERARSDWVRGLGIDQTALRARGLVFVVRRIAAAFIAPARLDDRLEVVTIPARTGGARATLDQSVRRADADIFRAEVELVLIDMASGAPRRLPEALGRAGG